MTSVTSTDSILSSYLTNQSAAVSADASSTSTSSSLTSVTGDLTTFLEILTTQLQNQDPTNSTDTNQFTQELVMFMQAEQQINTNTKLDNISNLLSTSSLSTGIGYIGNYVESASSSRQISLQDGFSEMGFTLDGDAESLIVTIYDSDGNSVATLSGSGTSGVNYVSWDGKDSSGESVEDGTYTFTVVATDSTDQAVTVSDYTTIARVDSVQSSDDGTLSLVCGDLIVSDDDVTSVYTQGSLPSASTSTDDEESSS